MKELTKEQLERQDWVESVIFAALEQLVEKELKFDTSLIGEIRDAIEEAFVNRGIMSEMEFYPYLEG